MTQPNPVADERPDWAEGRRQCPTCRDWKPLTKAGLLVKHKRQEPGRWHMVPCSPANQQPLPERSAEGGDQ